MTLLWRKCSQHLVAITDQVRFEAQLNGIFSTKSLVTTATINVLASIATTIIYLEASTTALFSPALAPPRRCDGAVSYTHLTLPTKA